MDTNIARYTSCIRLLLKDGRNVWRNLDKFQINGVNIKGPKKFELFSEFTLLHEGRRKGVKSDAVSLCSEDVYDH